MKKLYTASALTAALLCAPLASQAATATPAQFNVLLTLLASCTITEATDLDFGTQTEDDVNEGGDITSTSTIDVRCSNGTAYDIGLSGTNGSRAMTTAAGSSVAYELYQEMPVTASTGTIPAWYPKQVTETRNNSLYMV